jgi:hypothetical protein
MIPRMSAASPTVRKVSQPHTSAGASIRDWVEALAKGSCSSAELLTHLRELGRQDPESIWEALALLDQSYRSRRIDRETFLPIKSELQQFALRRNPAADTAAGSGGAAAAPLEAVAPTPVPPAVVQVRAPAPVRVGSVLRERYRIIGVLGKSATGTVVEAIDEMRADAPDNVQRIAIRILDSALLRESGQMSSYLARICKLQALTHPNVLRIFDFDQDHGRPFLTMELLSGASLPQLLAPADSPLRFQLDRRHVLRCIAGALQFAHESGIVHGELSAEEVFITLSGDVRLMGLDRGFNKSIDDVAKDHLAFAWLVRDLLGGAATSTSGRLRRPEGLNDTQWRALEAVIHGNASEGARLLQLFAESTRVAGMDEIYAVAHVPSQPGTSGSNARTRGKGKWIWALLVVGMAGGAGYLNYEPLERQMPIVRVPNPEPPAKAPKVESPAPNVPLPMAEVQTVEIAPESPPAVRHSTLNLARAAIQVEDSNTVARVRVVRQGNLSRSASFVWWTESGSAEPDVDFYPVTPRGAQIPANSASIDLFVPLVPNARHAEPVTFYVKIDEVGSGAVLGSRTLAQVSVVPPGYVAPAASTPD